VQFLSELRHKGAVNCVRFSPDGEVRGSMSRASRLPSHVSTTRLTAPSPLPFQRLSFAARNFDTHSPVCLIAHDLQASIWQPGMTVRFAERLTFSVSPLSYPPPLFPLHSRVHPADARSFCAHSWCRRGPRAAVAAGRVRRTCGEFGAGAARKCGALAVHTAAASASQRRVRPRVVARLQHARIRLCG